MRRLKSLTNYLLLSATGIALCYIFYGSFAHGEMVDKVLHSHILSSGGSKGESSSYILTECVIGEPIEREFQGNEFKILGGYIYTDIYNIPPRIKRIEDKTVKEGECLKFVVEATDEDGDDIEYFASNLPQGAKFHSDSHTFEWTPDFTQAGVYIDVVFEVFDGRSWDNENVNITVTNVNQPPFLTPIGEKTIKEGELLEFSISAEDIDEDELNYSCSNLPSGAVFDSERCLFSWEPDFEQEGSYPGVHFEVTDGELVSYEDITITVLNTNRPPVLDGIDEELVTEGDLVEFSLTGNDPDGDEVSWSVLDIPEDADFDDVDGKFSWQTDHNDIGRYKVIFVLSDGELVTEESVSIEVASFNQVSAYEHLVDRMDTYFSGEEARLIESYAYPYPLDAVGNPILERQAFVYDNALAVIAFLARGMPDDCRRARLISEAFMELQAIDSVGDGRIRDFYDASVIPFVDNDEGSYAGNMAWVINAWMHYYKYSGDDDRDFLSQILSSAERLGNFVVDNYRDPKEYGFFIGFDYESDPSPGPGKSTEHNISLYVAFMQLYEVTGDLFWKEEADWAKEYVLSKFNGEFFTAGTMDEEVEDVNSWAVLALGQVKNFEKAVLWVEKNLSLIHHSWTGFDFNIDKDGVWFEGTLHMALSYQVIGRKTSSDFYLDELYCVQKESIGANGKAIVSACHSRDDTGKVDGVSALGFDYFASPHIAATSWFILAEKEYNPFWGVRTDEGIPYDEDAPLLPEVPDEEGIFPPQLYPVKTPTNVPVQTIKGLKSPGTSVWLNGVEIIPLGEEGTFSYTIMLSEGENALHFTARDSQQKESEATVLNIILDTIAPLVDITYPTHGALTKSHDISVSGTIQGDAKIVEVNGRLAIIDGSNFTVENIILKEGLNVITATAQDEAGNKDSNVVPVISDNTPPSIPELDDYPSLTKVPIQDFSGEKDIQTSILLNGKEIVPLDAESVWSYEGFLLKEGLNELSFSSKDIMGNESEPIDIEIILDTIPPERPTISPVDSPTKIAVQVVSGTKSKDTTEVTIFSEEAISIDEVTYPDECSWECKITLREGENKITPFAQDKAGNKIMGEEISVTLDTTPPLFEVLFPTDASYIGGM